MGGGLKADLSLGAVPRLWSESGRPTAEGWHPVLQVVSVTHMPDANLPTAPPPAQYRLPTAPPPAQYRLRLSDGVHSQYATLASTLDPLASCGVLRQGSVVRLLRFVNIPDPKHVRTIFIFELKILQTNCPLIGRLKLYQPSSNSSGSSSSRSMLSQQTSRDRAGAAR